MKKICFGVVATLGLFTQLFAYNSGNCGCRCGKFEIGADWLYWRSFQDDLEYASIVTTTTDTTVVSTDIDPIHPDFRTKSGFRVFANYVFPCNPWQITASYVRWTAKTNRFDSVDGDDSEILFNPLFPVFSFFVNEEIGLLSIGSNWDTRFNYFDLDVGRPFCVCSCFDIIPHLGFRGMWIRQRLDLDGTSPGDEGGLFNFSGDLHQKFNGYGLEGGLRAYLRLGWGISLTGYLNGALLYAEVDVDESIAFVSTDVTQNTTVSEDLWHLSPGFDGFIGLEYGRNVCSCFLNVHAGWETHIIMNCNHLSLVHFSDLTFQGLTLGASLVF